MSSTIELDGCAYRLATVAAGNEAEGGPVRLELHGAADLDHFFEARSVVMHLSRKDAAELARLLMSQAMANRRRGR